MQKETTVSVAYGTNEQTHHRQKSSPVATPRARDVRQHHARSIDGAFPFPYRRSACPDSSRQIYKVDATYHRDVVGHVGVGDTGDGVALLATQLEEHLLQGQAVVRRKQGAGRLLGQQLAGSH